MNPIPLALVAAAATSSAALLGALAPSPPVAPASSRSEAMATHPETIWPAQPPDLERDFEAPEQYGPGHRGVDLLVRPGQVVRAARAGRIQFVGRVAGRSVIVIAHTGDLRTTYLPVSPLVQTGDHVTAGDPIGQVTAGSHCRAGPCLHWGARHGDTYIDPVSLLPGQVVLLPMSDEDPWATSRSR